MVCVRLEFPLGVYHALSDRGDRPEWAPSPVRLVGALLAAAEEVPSGNTGADREVLQRLCEAPPPVVFAPRAVSSRVQREEDGTVPMTVAELRGASRWAPRNPSPSELKKDLPGAKTVNVAEVNKGGVAVGDIPVAMAWPDLELGTAERERLRRMIGDIAWLGTSRSPVLCQLIDEPEEEVVPAQITRWEPLPWGSERLPDARIRVPRTSLIRDLDTAFEARRAKRDRVESASLVPRPPVELWPYEIVDPAQAGSSFDPRHWGRFVIVELDRESEMVPRASGVYVAARAFRAALMNAFSERGDSDEAPATLHGHDGHPHLAVVPLPFAGHTHGDGRVLGIALLYPHPNRAPDTDASADQIEATIARFLPGAGDRRLAIKVPGAGGFRIKSTEATNALTLSKRRYVGPSRRWTTATPVVHSRWRKGNDDAALTAQVEADCRHVGVPAPKSIERLRSSALRGGGNSIVPAPDRLRPEWRHTVQGPRSHLLLEFDRPIVGPLVLGKARHFGLGLCIPIERAGDE